MSSGLRDLTVDVLRSAFGRFPSGVTAVAAMCDGRPEGLAASSFTAVSIEPPLVSICVAHSSSTWPVLREAQCLGLSVLAEDHGPVARALAAKGIDRFADVEWEESAGGAVFVHGSALWLDCARFVAFPAGDHDIVVLSVRRVWTYPAVAPLVFHGSAFRALRATDSDSDLCGRRS